MKINQSETPEPDQAAQARADGMADTIRSVEKRGYVHIGYYEGEPKFLNMETERPDPTPYKGGD